GIAVAVITGAGRAFTAGQDLGEMATPKKYTDGKRHGFTPFIETVEAFPKPLIAAVNGLGVGIGLTMLPHCDLVLMSEQAQLRAPFVSLGVTVEAGNSFLLPRTVGGANAAHLLYTSEWLSAQKCHELGLVWKVTKADTLLAETFEVADQIAAMPIPSLVETKRLLLDARLEGVRAAREREIVRFAALAGGPANREAIAAFEEKREPDFTNLPNA
ncbi:enoyl-CoA hydratase/isomerase family protein, partial [bacterium AH-315-P15]|nr:enoyl-CoA hydratase/isomerase family protein [bacterium AH-315-P15]